MIPSISVVVPCKHNSRTIHETVTALLAQDYAGLVEVILVGSVNDTTWKAITNIRDPRLKIVEYGLAYGRDPNSKRDYGIRNSSGDLLALADSDIVMRPGWLSDAVGLLQHYEVDCVAGGMLSIHDSFWGRYVDYTRLGAKTPRVRAAYMVTASDFGHRGRKPPITANVVFTREMYNRTPLDVNWIYGYEDYEWFWRVAEAGNRVLFDEGLEGRHHHRRGLRPLATEYLRSSHGCAQLIRRHPDCPLARKRLLQAKIMPVLALVAGSAGTGLAVDGHWAATLCGVILISAVGSIWEFARIRSLESLLYPPITCIFACVYVYGLLRGLRHQGPVPRRDPATVAAERLSR